MTPTIEVLIKPDGTIVIETTNVVGPSCEALTKHLESAVGTVTGHTRKPEFFQPQTMVQQCTSSSIARDG